MNGAPPLLGVVGPTASGKTDLALALARRLPVEILVADSRQVVRGMDVGTAKPDAAARAAVRHHLIDVVDPDEPFTVAEWVERARALIPAIAARGSLPMIVGGTGLYVAALVDGHDYASQAWSPEVRRRLEGRLASEGLPALAAELAAREPDLAARTDLANPRRVLRALERSLAGSVGAVPESSPYPGRVVLLGIRRPRDELARRIERRARRMFAEEGLLDEVRRLGERGYGPQLRPMTGHGYQEAIRFLAGEGSLEDAIADTVRRTRQYAKRQMTWFSRDARIRWIDAGDRDAGDAALVDRAERMIREALS